MGSGKSAVAKSLAKRLELPLIDVDKMIEAKLKMKTTEVYDRFGDAYYRAMETMILIELQSNTERSIIVLGSGLALMPKNAVYLKELGTVYYLAVKLETVVAKLAKQEKHAWLRAGDLEARVSMMMKEREPAYRRIANVTVEVDGKTVDEICDEIIAAEERAGEQSED
jgi:shikimate kinase